MAQNKFIQQNVDKIMKEFENKFPLNFAMSAAWIAANFKGFNIKIFDVANTSSLADYYLICSTQNPMQSRAMVDEMTSNLKRHGAKTISNEGLDSADWVLLDMGDIIVHVFLDNTREIYDLDALWMKYEQVQIPEEYYFSAQNNQTSTETSEEDKQYF